MSFENIPENRNLKVTIVNDKYVSSAEIWRHLAYAEGFVNSFETFVWEWDLSSQERLTLLHMTYQDSEEECLIVHEHMVTNFLHEL
jgi:hypothetical protein